MGKCPRCGEWNTFSQEEERGEPIIKEPVPITSIKPQEGMFIPTGIKEFDRVLGGGIVKGSLILLGGDPGIGKSTLSLQVAGALSDRLGKVLYFSGEESESQIALRAERIGALKENLEVVSEVDTDILKALVESGKYGFVVVDSVQTLSSRDVDGLPGSISQVRKAVEVLLGLSKGRDIPILLIGHITKEGYIAGPKALEHMVDVVLYFEGDKEHAYRILRPSKNRFASTRDIGVLEMTEEGLKDVENPSMFFVSERPKGEPGSVVASIVVEKRPLLVEVQALVAETHFGMPKRTFIGLDPQRASLIISILEKKLLIPLGGYDVFVNVTGGLRVKETGIDLATAVSILSSFYERPVPEDSAFFGEVGLTGEVRRVGYSEERIKEASRLGYRRIYLPKGVDVSPGDAELFKVENLKELKEVLFK